MQSSPIPEKTSSLRNRAFSLALIGAGLIVFGLLGIFLWPKQAADPSPSRPAPGNGLVPPAEVSFPAPSLTLTDLQGNSVSLADLRGQVVLVNNWAIWCPPCKLEMPDLNAYYRDHASQGFLVIGIEAGTPGPEVAAFAAQMGITFPIWLDPNTEALRGFQNDYLPSSYLIDRDGIVLLTWTGAINRESLEHYVTPLLEN